MISNTITDPILNDFLYTILFNASYAEKRSLPGRFLKAAMTQSACKKFIEKSTDEDKKILLSHFGYRFFWTLMKRDFDKSKLKEILDNFDEDKKATALRSVADNGIFVTSDKEFVRLLSYISSAIHQSSYFLDLEYKRQGYHIQKWKKRNFIERDLLVRELDENAVSIAKLISASLTVMEQIRERIGLTTIQLRILLYLYTKPHLYFSEDHIVEHFCGVLSRAMVSRSTRGLLKIRCVDSETHSGKLTYTINALGTKKVAEYFKTIFDKNIL